MQTGGLIMETHNLPLFKWLVYGAVLSEFTIQYEPYANARKKFSDFFKGSILLGSIITMFSIIMWGQL